jgi:hypothetical protein
MNLHPNEIQFNCPDLVDVSMLNNVNELTIHNCPKITDTSMLTNMVGMDNKCFDMVKKLNHYYN